MRRIPRFRLILVVGAVLAASRPVRTDTESAPRSGPAFQLALPHGIATGRVALTALSDDPRVAAVLWTVAGLTRRAGPPAFAATFDLGAIPQERPVLAVAVDGNGRPLYQQEAVLNPGERAVGVEILSPLQGQSVAGPVTVRVRARIPPDDAVGSITLDAGGGAWPLSGTGEVRSAVVQIPGETTAVTALLRTEGGRVSQKTVLLNGRGVLTSSEAHIVDQIVGVYRGSDPVENLTAADFRVRDAGGACEIREAKLLRDSPLAVGLLVDTSQSLMLMDALRRTTADLFIDRGLKRGDEAFLMRFGPAVFKVVSWTRDLSALREAVLALEDDEAPGTLLYEGILRALYQFQGGQGARALLLITDGWAFDDDVDESAALAYARNSGVVIYALALPSTGEISKRRKEKDAEGRSVERSVLIPVRQEPNLATLEKFARATGGRLYPVAKAEDLPRFYEQIGRDLRTQYLLSYVPNTKRTNSFHAVEVTARRGRVRTAPGFFY